MEPTIKISDEKTRIGLTIGYMCSWAFMKNGKKYAQVKQYQEKPTEESLKKEAMERYKEIED